MTDPAPMHRRFTRCAPAWHGSGFAGFLFIPLVTLARFDAMRSNRASSPSVYSIHPVHPDAGIPIGIGLTLG